VAILAKSATRVLIQGITGREAATFALESLRYGTNIVAGVTPGKGGSNVHGIPVFDSIGAALRYCPCDATIISVPAQFAREAAWEALDHGIELLVIVTERIPRKDVVAILERARSFGSRVIGPNSLGVISPGMARIGMCGGAVEAVRLAYSPGSVGIISRSGGMMTEIANMLTQSGIGQSTCISIGGDPIVGSTFLDLLPLYEADPATKALVLFCEPGGSMEERLADCLKNRKSRLPIIAFVAGRFTDRNPGVRFGHAGAMVVGIRGSPAGKIATLRGAGVVVAEHLSQVPSLLQSQLEIPEYEHLYQDRGPA
jgi:succinyl-CoA synthetase alpha subunit